MSCCTDQRGETQHLAVLLLDLAGLLCTGERVLSERSSREEPMSLGDLMSHSLSREDFYPAISVLLGL